MIEIAPSILSADFAAFGSAVIALEQAGADRIHCDVMDGVFVPQITFGSKTIEALKAYTKLPLDVHLMIMHAERHIDSFARAGASLISVHAEECVHLQRVLSLIHSYGIKASVVLNPATSIDYAIEVLEDIDEVLIMTVNPGFGGQEFLPSSLDKIRRMREAISTSGINIDIKVDGGISPITAPQVIEAGANVLVAGAAVFTSDDMRGMISQLRGE